MKMKRSNTGREQSAEMKDMSGAFSTMPIGITTSKLTNRKVTRTRPSILHIVDH
jgi:hypothetical protein